MLCTQLANTVWGVCTVALQTPASWSACGFTRVSAPVSDGLHCMHACLISAVSTAAAELPGVWFAVLAKGHHSTACLHLPPTLPADADRLVSGADLAQFGKLVVAVAKKYFTLPGGCRQLQAGWG